MCKKLFKIFLIELFIVVIIFFYLYYSNIQVKPKLVDSSPTVTTKESLRESFTNKLNTYEEFEKALLEGKEKNYIKNSLRYKDPKEIFGVLENISIENPKVMYYKGAEYSLGKLTISYSKSKEDIKNHQDEIEKVREEFIRENISESMSDYEKILKIHDYIVINSRYDERLEQNGSVPPESNSSYGILVLGVGVCEGYAKSMKYLLDASDIESRIVVGVSRGENHVWNLVNIGGEYYHIDPTWDDPITNDGSDILRYNYFNLSDDEISRSHSWDRDKYPVADNNKYNYFSYNDLVVSGIDGLEDKLKRSLLLGEDNLSVKMLNYDVKGIKIDGIIENIVYNNHMSINLKSYSYSLDGEQCIINFRFSYH